MGGGYLRIEGESEAEAEEEQASGNKEQEDVFDGAGNKIDVKAQAALSEKDKKKKIKDIEKKIKDNKKKKTLTEEEAWELEDQLTELKREPEGMSSFRRFCSRLCIRNETCVGEM